MKIRGTPQHIGEKYLQLARDAQASGDPVMAESYLQHAEHYFRLIAGAQQGFGGYQIPPADANAEDSEEEVDFGRLPDRFGSPLERVAPAPQPGFMPKSLTPSGQPGPDRQPHMRPERTRPERANYRERDFQPPAEKPYQEQRAFQERSGGGREPENRGSHRGSREYRGEHPSRVDPRGEMQFAESAVENNGLPAFITSPLRVAAEASDAAPAEAHPLPPDVNVAAGGYPRPRRRRMGKAEPEAAGLPVGIDDTAGDPVED